MSELLQADNHYLEGAVWNDSGSWYIYIYLFNFIIEDHSHLSLSVFAIGQTDKSIFNKRIDTL